NRRPIDRCLRPASGVELAPQPAGGTPPRRIEMAEQPQAAPPDPLTVWRDWAAQMEDQWNRMFNQAMGSDQFASAMGRSMEAALMLQQRLAQQFEATLKAWN